VVAFADLDVGLLGVPAPGEKRLEPIGLSKPLCGVKVLFELVVGEGRMNLLVAGLTETSSGTFLPVFGDQVVFGRFDRAPAEFTPIHRRPFVLCAIHPFVVVRIMITDFRRQ
jgi:hypothetical protein